MDCCSYCMYCMYVILIIFSVFSKGVTFRMFIFNWFCLVTDFLGIFVSVSWAFYQTNDKDELTDVGLVFIYKFFFLSGVYAAILMLSVCILIASYR